MSDELLNATLERLSNLSAALRDLGLADGHLERAANALGQYPTIPISALGDMLDFARERVAERLYEVARQYGWQVATYEIAPIARESGDESVVFITGNSHMPPLRAFGNSEAVWLLDDDGELFAAYADALEGRLDELNVYMGVPEYDNALYVVDLTRFEHVREEDEHGAPLGESLSDEWRKHEASE